MNYLSYPYPDDELPIPYHLYYHKVYRLAGFYSYIRKHFNKRKAAYTRLLGITGRDLNVVGMFCACARNASSSCEPLMQAISSNPSSSDFEYGYRLWRI